MTKSEWLVYTVFIMIVGSLAVIPAYAEVTSFQTNQSFYTPGNKIYFTGTVDIGDYQKLVNLVIHDPNGKFVLISGNYSDTTYTFEMVVDTNNTAFSTKGTYQAIAFVGKESDGKTLNFDFSPDGSPVIHKILPSTNTPGTANSSQSLPQNYQLHLNENVGLTDTAKNLTKTIIPTSVSEEKSLNQFDYKNILYPLISICGAGIVVAILYVRKRRGNTGTQRPQGMQQTSASADVVNPENDYALMILKNRLAKGEITVEEFKDIKNALDEP